MWFFRFLVASASLSAACWRSARNSGSVSLAGVSHRLKASRLAVQVSNIRVSHCSSVTPLHPWLSGVDGLLDISSGRMCRRIWPLVLVEFGVRPQLEHLPPVGSVNVPAQAGRPLCVRVAWWVGVVLFM